MTEAKLLLARKLQAGCACALLGAAALALGGCDKGENRSAGQAVDDAVARTERAAEEAKAKTEQMAQEARAKVHRASRRRPRTPAAPWPRRPTTPPSRPP